MAKNTLTMERAKRYFEGLQIRGNIYVALVFRLALVMVLFAACRVGFFFFNLNSFSHVKTPYFWHLMKSGLVFDASAILYVNVLYIALMVFPLNIRFNRYYQISLKYLFVITNGFALAANVADFIYYKFTLRRTTVDIFRQFENETNLAGLLYHFVVDYWYAVVVLLMFLFLLIVFYNVVRVRGPQLKNEMAYYVSGIVAMLIVITLFVGGVRGGYRLSRKPITVRNAGEFVKDPRDISIVLNTPFVILHTLGKTKVEELNHFSASELESIYNPVHVPSDSIPFGKKNVVVIILESFSKEFFGALNRDKKYGKYDGYTPFLDSLIQSSLTFDFSFANGQKSIDDLPSILSSIPSLNVTHFLSSGNDMNSLPSLLGENGYHTSFFNGAPNGSTGFEDFMTEAGVQHYFGKTEYHNDVDFDGIRGIWDEKFLNFYADKMNEFPQPFMSTFFSVSTHHPFKIPDEYDHLFKGGPLEIHKCVEYTDYSLELFFNKIKEMPWYENTLFVITSDHTSSEVEFPESHTSWGHYTVPIIFFAPDNSLASRSKQLAQQIDIMPSVLGYLHYDKPYVAFGRDILRESSEPFAINYNHAYQFFQDQYFFQYDGTKPIGLYNFKKDRLLHRNLVNEESDLLQAMEKKTKAIIQQYNNRMIENRLKVE